jgi:hypothetical protein
VKLLSRIAGLSSRQRRLLARAFALLAWFRVGLLALPLDSLLRGIERGSVAARRADFSPVDAAWAVGAVARRVPGTHCLARSLALHALLRRSGFESELRIGVARAAPGIAAHAWVECGGEALDDPSAARSYAAFDALPR